jgi:RHS repeat-associated protein
VGVTDQEFLWDPARGIPLLISDDTYSFIYGPGLTPIAQVDHNGAVEYLYGDNLGSVRTIADDAGNVVSTTSFDPYGQIEDHVGLASSTIGYTGAWTDVTTGLVYLRARDYDPATGQFVTVDPIVDQTRQPYAYVANNPLAATDPRGLDYCLASGGTCVPDGPTPTYRARSQTTQEHLKDVYWACLYAIVEANKWRTIEDNIKGLSPELQGFMRWYMSDGSDLAAASAPLLSVLAGARLGGAGTTAAPSGPKTPSFVVDSYGNVSTVPKGATGPYATNNGVGANYTGGSGGFGLHPSVTDVRVIPPGSQSGGRPYPNGVTIYTNQSGQKVNPQTGRTVGNDDPYAHWEGHGPLQ